MLLWEQLSIVAILYAWSCGLSLCDLGGRVDGPPRRPILDLPLQVIGAI